MSLRWRFALIFSTGAILATVVVASAAVWSTSRSLESEIDGFLQSRVHEAERVRIPELPASGLITLQTFGEPIRVGGQRITRNRTPFLPALDSIIQINRADGSLALTLEDSPHLPAHELDNSSPEYFTVEVNDTRYRVGAYIAESGSIVQIARDLTETEAVTQRLRSQIGLVGLAFAFVAGFGGWLAARRLVSPVEDLSAAAEAIARTRDLSTSIEVHGHDEIGRLGKSFNTMLDALRTSRAQQRRLVQDASHELRTPLTSLRTNVEVLLRTPDLPLDEQDDILGDVDSELRELSDLVTELVELATDADRVEEPEQEVDLGALVEGVAERARRRTGRMIDVKSDSTRVSVRTSMIERAVSNLIDNAHKWSPAGEAVTVTVARSRVAVRDNGPGISKDDLPNIFDRFYRSDRARATPGSGLGLAIVAQLIEAHNGTVFALNPPEGGAEVGFEL